MIADLNTYLTKAIPDTKLTIEKYADAKFEYLVGISYRTKMMKIFKQIIMKNFNEIQGNVEK